MSIAARADVRVLGALAQLQGHPDFDIFTEYLGKQLALESQATLDAVEGYAAMKQLGRQSLLAELVRLIADPRGRLEGLQNRVVPRNTPVVRMTDAY